MYPYFPYYPTRIHIHYCLFIVMKTSSFLILSVYEIFSALFHHHTPKTSNLAISALSPRLWSIKSDILLEAFYKCLFGVYTYRVGSEKISFVIKRLFCLCWMFNLFKFFHYMRFYFSGKWNCKLSPILHHLRLVYR